MKKKLALFMAVVFSCLILLAGCAGSGASPFEGTWKLTKGESSGITLDAEVLESAMGEVTITLEKGGKAPEKVPSAATRKEPGKQKITRPLWLPWMERIRK